MATAANTTTAPRRSRKKADTAAASTPAKRSRKAADTAQQGKGDDDRQQQALPLSEALEKGRQHMGTSDKQGAGTKGGDTPAPAKRSRKPAAQQPKGQEKAPEQPKGDEGGAGQASGGDEGGANEASDGIVEVNGEQRGGLKQVLIQSMPLSGRGGRHVAPEVYPFGALPHSKKVDGEIDGPSFFIPDADNPDSLVASARKRHKGVAFLTRKREEVVDEGQPAVKGVRVWKAPLEE